MINKELDYVVENETVDIIYKVVKLEEGPQNLRDEIAKIKRNNQGAKYHIYNEKVYLKKAVPKDQVVQYETEDAKYININGSLAFVEPKTYEEKMPEIIEKAEVAAEKKLDDAMKNLAVQALSGKQSKLASASTRALTAYNEKKEVSKGEAIVPFVTFNESVENYKMTVNCEVLGEDVLTIENVTKKIENEDKTKDDSMKYVYRATVENPLGIMGDNVLEERG